MFCSKCGEKLKDAAKFCHACGAEVLTGRPAEANVESNSKTEKLTTRGWLNSFGAFLFIPIFAIIIVLLFWANREPEPINAAAQQQASAQANSAPAMAQMQQIHVILESLQARIEKNPRDLVAIDSLAVMYAIAGSYDKAKSYYEKHLEIEPDNKDIKIGLALTYHNLTQTDKAIALIKEVLDKDPTYVFGLHYLAEIYASIHEHEKAIETWKSIIEHYPNTDFAEMASKRIKEQTQSDE